MRHRVYFFVWAMLVTIFLIAWAVFGGEGWLMIALIASNGALVSFIVILQITAYSDVIISDDLKSSTDGKSFATCRALGERKVNIVVARQVDPENSKSYIESYTREVTVPAWPAVRFFEGGTGEWGLAKKLGGGHLGFIIVSEELLLDLSPVGNMVGLGKTWTLRPHKLSFLELLRRVKPTEKDPRRVLPAEWWDILASHDRFDPQVSPVHVIIDPKFPIITRDRLKKKTYLSLPGLDTEKRIVLPTWVPLADIAADYPILDLRPEMQKLREETAESARKWAGSEVDKHRSYEQWLEAKLAHATSIEEVAEGRKQLLGDVYEVVAGPEESMRRGG